MPFWPYPVSIHTFHMRSGRTNYRPAARHESWTSTLHLSREEYSGRAPPPPSNENYQRLDHTVPCTSAHFGRFFDASWGPADLTVLWGFNILLQQNTFFCGLLKSNICIEIRIPGAVTSRCLRSAFLAVPRINLYFSRALWAHELPPIRSTRILDFDPTPLP